MLSLCLRKSSFIYWKKTAPPPPEKTNGLAVPNKENESRVHSSIPTLPGTATKF